MGNHQESECLCRDVRSCEEVREAWLNEKCKEMEIL